MGRTRGDTARGERFELFAECLLLGFLVTLAALPGFTLLAAVAAGSDRVRAVVEGRPSTTADFLGRLRQALPGSAPLSLGLLAACALLLFDLGVARSTPLPGGPAVVVVTAALLGLVLVVALRAAARWCPGDPWRASVLAARRTVVDDPAGTLLLAAALCLVVAVATAFVMVLPLLLGVLVMAVVAVEERSRPRGMGESR